MRAAIGQVCGWYPQNPRSGVTSFDNGLLASLAVFQTITLEGWSDIMYFLMDSTDEFSGVCYELARASPPARRAPSVSRLLRRRSGSHRCDGSCLPNCSLRCS